MKTLVTTLLILGFTLTAFAQDKNEKLYEAVNKNDKYKVEQLINIGADVNYIKQSGPWMKISILITAVNKKNIEVTELLLKNKADVNWKDGFNTSAIMYAASTGDMEMVKLLLKYGADINDSDGKGNTVLSAAQESKNNSLIEFVEEKNKEKK